jgi:hypothetical protein
MQNAARIRPLVLLLGCSLFVASKVYALTIAGKEARPGSVIEIQFPVSKYFQDKAAWGGNPRPQTGRAVLSFPPGFDPARRWPIMVITSSTDFQRGSPEYARFLTEPANAEGWMIVASDATIKANHDSTPWRLAMLGAAFEAIRKDMPQSRNWPVAFCGHSGGAKRSCLLGAMMAQAHAVNICGFFLSGINDDKMSESYKTYQPGRDFLNIPVWISGGNEDPIATPGLEGQMMANMRRTGFTRVRLEHFPGVHQMRRSELKLALRWFRELGGF